jgi:hypothetical protein
VRGRCGGDGGEPFVDGSLPCPTGFRGVELG